MSRDGRNMRILRDLRLSTKVLILFELVRRPGVGQRELASTLEVTPQAVSEYLKHMEEEALVERENRTVRPTMTGFQFLQDNLRELGDFIYRAMREVRVINTCAAIAGEDLEEGVPVVLELEDGFIVARRGQEGSSTGVAARDAGTGEDLAVLDLEGMLEYTSGSVTVVALPSAVEGGSTATDLPALRERVEGVDPDIVVAVDPVGVVVARQLELEVDVHFGVDRATVDAAVRGLDVLVLGGRDTVGDVLDAVAGHNERSETLIDHSLIEMPRRP